MNIHSVSLLKCPKNRFFVVAEMAFIHAGTKYIKRPQDFENFLKFRYTLVSRHHQDDLGAIRVK